MENLVVCKAIICNDKQQILALRRSETDTRRPLEWDLPGGKIEESEGLQDGCAREIGEEAGLEVPPQNLEVIYGHSEMTDRGNITWIYFLTHSKETAVTLSWEHDKYEWKSLENALDTFIYPRQHKVLTYIHDNNLLDLVS